MRSLLYASLATTALAFPLFPHRRSPQPPSYNVVPVSGHELPSPQEDRLRPREPIPDPKAAAPSYSVVAVDGANAPPAQTETIVTTRLSTIVITTANTPQTVVVTVTDTVPSPTGPANNDATVTVTAPAGPGETQTRPYDNGMWHTTYYYTTVVPTPTAAPAPLNNAAAQPQEDNTNNAPWEDASDDLPGVQMVGGAPIRENPAAAGGDRKAWLEGQWAPWNGENNGQDQSQGQQGGAQGENAPAGGAADGAGAGAGGVSFGNGALAAGRPGTGS